MGELRGLCGAVDKVGMARTTRTGRQGQLFGFYGTKGTSTCNDRRDGEGKGD
jgi:hypothetical protein